MFALGFTAPSAVGVRTTRGSRAICSRSPRMMAQATAAHTLDGRTIGGALEPVGHNLLVRVAEAEEQTQGGLFLASTAKEKPTYGVAVAVGGGKVMSSGVGIPMQISAGDTVLYGKYGGTDVVYDGTPEVYPSSMAIRALHTGVPRRATHAFVAPFATAAINVERTARDAAVVTWAAPAAPARAAYVFEYGLSRRATLRPRVEVRNLTPGQEYKCRVWRSDTGAEVASGTLSMTLSDSTPASTTTSAAAGAAAAPTSEPELPLTELSRLEVRVGVIKEIAKHPDADSLYVEKVDVGEEAPRTIVSGLVKYCSEEDLLNRRVIVLCNLKPRAMRGVTSHGMLLCASDAEHTKVDPLLPPEDAQLGELITFDGHRSAPVDPGNRATKAFDRVADKLSCGEDGVARFEDIPFMTSKGACTSPMKLVGPVS